jgi:hypothetical protein
MEQIQGTGEYTAWSQRQSLVIRSATFHLLLCCSGYASPNLPVLRGRSLVWHSTWPYWSVDPARPPEPRSTGVPQCRCSGLLQATGNASQRASCCNLYITKTAPKLGSMWSDMHIIFQKLANAHKKTCLLGSWWSAAGSPNDC